MNKYASSKLSKGMSAGPCPCGGSLAATTDPPSIIHTIPACADFWKLEPAAFLEKVRKARGGDGDA